MNILLQIPPFFLQGKQKGNGLIEGPSLHNFHASWFPPPPLQVVRLRETERRWRLRCKELELQVGERELSLKELKLATRRVILDADRRRTQQHQRHQSDIQLLLHKLKGEGRPRGGAKWWPGVDVTASHDSRYCGVSSSLLMDVSSFFFCI